jgi:hypothetical protein
MALGRKTGGRTKGTPNKTTQAAKDAIALVAENLGGPDRMLAWAQEDPLNERIFWSQIYPKLLPLTLNGTGEDDAIKTSVTVEFVAPK